jgi:hypothetical protein
VDLLKRDALISVLATAANTDAAIRWDVLHKTMAEAPPGLTDLERAELLLHAANGVKLTVQQWNQLVGAVVMRAAKDRPVALMPVDRAGLVANLQVILKISVEGKERERAALAIDVAKIASGMVVLVPSWSARVRVDRIVARSVRGALAYGLWLFADASRPFGKDLCRCGFEKCQIFFFRRAPDGGRGAPVRRYCKGDHARAGNRAMAAERMERIRGKRK